MFTGYIYERDLINGGRKCKENVTKEILDNVDVLVDGPFILEKKDLTLAFRGSSNQRLLTREDRKSLVG
jgi:anaerobic ribonucleoside-triphosphate reductase activating protein